MELLCPAGSMPALKAAIEHGADAVYIGLKDDTNARHFAGLNFDEAKLLNFFSGVGINFQNIASNDAMIGARIMELESEGYSLAYVTSGVESHAGTEDGTGLFITRMFFKRTTLQ